MSIFERLGSAKAAGLTFAANFWPWLLGAFLLGASMAGIGGYKIAKLVYQGDALRAQNQLANFEKSLAQSSAMGEAEAARRQKEALDAIHARDANTNAAVASIPAQVAAMLAPKFTALRETINAPQYDCMRQPLPGPYLRLLERPGGRAAEDGGHPDSGAGPGIVPNAASAGVP